MNGLFFFPAATRRNPAVELWLEQQGGELGQIARHSFELLRNCGEDVRFLLHDGHPTACVADAAFAYVDAFRAHVNLGFYRGAEIGDPAGLLAGSGRYMRHVRLEPGKPVDARALGALIRTAYRDMKARLVPG